MRECPSCGKEYQESSGIKYHMKQCCPEELAECPTCSELLLNDDGLNRHHARSHGESLLKDSFECAYCGTVQHRNPAKIRGKDKLYCNYECHGKDQRVEIPKQELYELYWRDHLTTYEIAPKYDVAYSVIQNRMNEHGIPLITKSKHHKAWLFTMRSDEWLRREYHDKEKSTYQIAHEHGVFQEWVRRQLHKRGVKPRDPGFVGYERGDWPTPKYDYGPNWPTQRRKALERDGYTCQSCGDHGDDITESLHVHHIVPFPSFDDTERANRLGNLVSFCPDCHNRWEGIPVKPTLLPTQPA